LHNNNKSRGAQWYKHNYINGIREGDVGARGYSFLRDADARRVRQEEEEEEEEV